MFAYLTLKVTRASTGMTLGIVVAMCGGVAIALHSSVIASGGAAASSAFVSVFVPGAIRIFFGFAAGAMMYAGWRACKRMTGQVWDAVAIVSLAVVIVALSSTTDIKIAIVVMPFLGLFIAGCAGATGIVGRFMSSRAMNGLGLSSYSLYLTHVAVLTILSKTPLFVRSESLGNARSLLTLAAYLACVITVGRVSYRVLEEPARRALLRRFRGEARRKAAPAQEPVRDAEPVEVRPR